MIVYKVVSILLAIGATLWLIILASLLWVFGRMS